MPTPAHGYKHVVPYLDLRRATAEIRVEIDSAIRGVLDSGTYIAGKEVERFEHQFASYCGAQYGVGAGNGLDALTLMLRGLGIGDGDEVIVAANTFIATWLAVTAAGARVIPVDPEVASANLSRAGIERALTPRTRAILITHLYGKVADMRALSELAETTGIFLLSDAAQAHGTKFQGYASAYSFYPNKNLGALGDGGAVVTNDPALAGTIRMLGNYGSREKYIHESAGVNSRLDPLQAAVLTVKLKYLDSWQARRAQIARRYLLALAGAPGLRLPRIDSAENAWHIFPVYHDRRDWVAAQLATRGVGTLIHYPEPPHLSGAYQNLGFSRGSFPITERLAATELSLPMYPQLSDDEVDRVIASVWETTQITQADSLNMYTSA